MDKVYYLPDHPTPEPTPANPILQAAYELSRIPPKQMPAFPQSRMPDFPVPGELATPAPVRRGLDVGTVVYTNSEATLVVTTKDHPPVQQQSLLPGLLLTFVAGALLALGVAHFIRFCQRA